jgi:hypothetical protein
MVSQARAHADHVPVAQSLPKRPKHASRRKVAEAMQDAANLLHVGHFPPPRAPRRLTTDLLWGTRGPEFKSRRPDSEVA